MNLARLARRPQRRPHLLHKILMSSSRRPCLSRVLIGLGVVLCLLLDILHNLVQVVHIGVVSLNDIVELLTDVPIIRTVDTSPHPACWPFCSFALVS